MKKTLIKLVLLPLLATPLIADNGPYETYNIRQKAMGGTQVTAIGSTAFYQNPAFLALEKIKICYSTNWYWC